MRGIIVAVNTSPMGGIPKYPREEVTIGRWGLVGDYHNQETRRSFSKPGTRKANADRHILIASLEAIQDAGEKVLKKALSSGALSENITVERMGCLSEIGPGQLVIIGSGLVLLETTGQELPCDVLKNAYNAKFCAAITGRRGLMCKIIRGVGRVIKPGYTIEIVGV